MLIKLRSPTLPVWLSALLWFTIVLLRGPKRCMLGDSSVSWVCWTSDGEVQHKILSSAVFITVLCTVGSIIFIYDAPHMIAPFFSRKHVALLIYYLMISFGYLVKIKPII